MKQKTPKSINLAAQKFQKQLAHFEMALFEVLKREEIKINDDFSKIRERILQVIENKQSEIVQSLYDGYYQTKPIIKEMRKKLNEIKFISQPNDKVFELLIK